VEALHKTPVRVALIVALLVVVVLAQNAAASLAPSGTSAQTGRLIGRAGFAYLSGIRTFAAAVLWNRLEPQFHEYYGGKQLAEQTQMLPTIRLVQMLDPQFVQSYYVAAWVAARHGQGAEGLDIARDGVKQNPASGLLRSSLIQIMLLEDKARYIREAVAQADAGTAPEMAWADDAEKLEGYAVFAATYRLAGMKQEAETAQAVAKSLAATTPTGSIGGAGHDHDGDGTPDH